MANNATEPDGTELAAPTPVQGISPRLVDLRGAGIYLGGLSAWTVRALISNGVIPIVRPPALRRRHETMRRVLIDVRDLDALIAKWKEQT